jgi:hypothetical protein
VEKEINYVNVRYNNMSIIKLNQKLKRIEITSYELDNKIIFNYFNNLPSEERDDKFLKAIYIGTLALMEDRLSTFLSKTSNELGTELESLKMIFDMKQEIFFKTTVKGVLAEEDIAEFLKGYLSDKKINDSVILTGNTAGSLPKNKTGDIVCEIDGKSGLKIVIECKFDKSIKLGPIASKDIFTKRSDTAWSQLIEAQANRDSKISIIVFDLALVDNSILNIYENVGFIPGVGLIAIVDSQKGNYVNLAIAYLLARDIALNSKEVELDKHQLTIIMNRIIKDIREILTIRNLVESNIENNKQILRQLEKSLLLAEFNQKYLVKFLSDGTLTKKDLLDFYNGEEVKDKYKPIEKQILEGY